MEQAFAVVVGFLGEPGVVGECAEERLAQGVIDLYIGFGDDLVAEAASAPVLAVAALLPAVAGARFPVALQDLAAASRGFLGGFEFRGQIERWRIDQKPACLSTSPTSSRLPR